MNRQIEEIRVARTCSLEQLEDLTVEQFNQIPLGFRNNISWNLGHMIVVQQQICYQQAGLPLTVTNEFAAKFAAGSTPDGPLNVIEIIVIKDLLVTTLQQLDDDYDKQIFTNYKPWNTRFGQKMMNIGDGLEFLAFHERLHCGIITAIRKMVKIEVQSLN